MSTVSRMGDHKGFFNMIFITWCVKMWREDKKYFGYKLLCF